MHWEKKLLAVHGTQDLTSIGVMWAGLLDWSVSRINSYNLKIID